MVAIPRESDSFQTHATSMLIATTAARVAAFPLETIKIMLQTNLVPFIAAAPAAPALDSFALQAQLHPSPSYFRALPVAVPAEVMELAGTRPPPPPQPPSLSGAPGRQQGLVAFRPYWDARECLRSLATVASENVAPRPFGVPIASHASNVGSTALTGAQVLPLPTLRSLFRGFTADLLVAYPSIATKLVCFQVLWQRSNTRMDTKRRTTFASFVQGGIAGALEGALTNSAELLRTRRLFQPTLKEVQTWSTTTSAWSKPPAAATTATTTATATATTIPAPTSSNSTVFQSPRAVAYEQGTGACISAIRSNEARGTLLSRGLVASVVARSVHGGVFFATMKKCYDAGRRAQFEALGITEGWRFAGHDHLRPRMGFWFWTGSAMLSGAVASLASHPFDTAKVYAHFVTEPRFDSSLSSVRHARLPLLRSIWRWNAAFQQYSDVSIWRGAGIRAVSSSLSAGVFAAVFQLCLFAVA